MFIPKTDSTGLREAPRSKNDINSKFYRPNIFREAAAGLGRGTEGLIGSVGDMANWMGEANNDPELAQWGREHSDYWKEQASTGWEAPVPGLTLGKNPFARSAGLLGEALPSVGLGLLGGGGAMKLGASLANGRKLSKIAQFGWGFLGTQPLGAVTGSSFYREARDNGLSVQEASKLAMLDWIAESALEVAPLMEFMKPGTNIARKLFSVGLTEGSEEVAQGVFGNVLKVYGWKGTDNLYQDITDGVLEGFVGGFLAGGVMGGGSAIVSKNQHTLEQISGDVWRTLKKDGVRDDNGKVYSFETISKTVDGVVSGALLKSQSDIVAKTTKVLNEKIGKLDTKTVARETADTRKEAYLAPNKDAQVDVKSIDRAAPDNTYSQLTSEQQTTVNSNLVSSMQELSDPKGVKLHAGEGRTLGLGDLPIYHKEKLLNLSAEALNNKTGIDNDAIIKILQENVIVPLGGVSSDATVDEQASQNQEVFYGPNMFEHITEGGAISRKSPITTLEILARDLGARSTIKDKKDSSYVDLGKIKFVGEGVDPTKAAEEFISVLNSGSYSAGSSPRITLSTRELTAELRHLGYSPEIINALNHVKSLIASGDAPAFLQYSQYLDTVFDKSTDGIHNIAQWTKDHADQMTVFADELQAWFEKEVKANPEIYKINNLADGVMHKMMHETVHYLLRTDQRENLKNLDKATTALTAKQVRANRYELIQESGIDNKLLTSLVSWDTKKNRPTSALMAQLEETVCEAVSYKMLYKDMSNKEAIETGKNTSFKSFSLMAWLDSYNTQNAQKMTMNDINEITNIFYLSALQKAKKQIAIANDIDLKKKLSTMDGWTTSKMARFNPFRTAQRRAGIYARAPIQFSKRSNYLASLQMELNASSDERVKVELRKRIAEVKESTSEDNTQFSRRTLYEEPGRKKGKKYWKTTVTVDETYNTGKALLKEGDQGTLKRRKKNIEIWHLKTRTGSKQVPAKDVPNEYKNPKGIKAEAFVPDRPVQMFEAPFDVAKNKMKALISGEKIDRLDVFEMARLGNKKAQAQVRAMEPYITNEEQQIIDAFLENRRELRTSEKADGAPEKDIATLNRKEEVIKVRNADIRKRRIIEDLQVEEYFKSMSEKVSGEETAKEINETPEGSIAKESLTASEVGSRGVTGDAKGFEHMFLKEFNEFLRNTKAYIYYAINEMYVGKSKENNKLLANSLKDLYYANPKKVDIQGDKLIGIVSRLEKNYITFTKFIESIDNIDTIKWGAKNHYMIELFKNVKKNKAGVANVSKRWSKYKKQWTAQGIIEGDPAKTVREVWSDLKQALIPNPHFNAQHETMLIGGYKLTQQEQEQFLKTRVAYMIDQLTMLQKAIAKRQDSELEKLKKRHMVITEKGVSLLNSRTHQDTYLAPGTYGIKKEGSKTTVTGNFDILIEGVMYNLKEIEVENSLFFDIPAEFTDVAFLNDQNIQNASWRGAVKKLGYMLTGEQKNALKTTLEPTILKEDMIEYSFALKALMALRKKIDPLLTDQEIREQLGVLGDPLRPNSFAKVKTNISEGDVNKIVADYINEKHAGTLARFNAGAISNIVHLTVYNYVEKEYPGKTKEEKQSIQRSLLDHMWFANQEIMTVKGTYNIRIADVGMPGPWQDGITNLPKYKGKRNTAEMEANVLIYTNLMEDQGTPMTTQEIEDLKKSKPALLYYSSLPKALQDTIIICKNEIEDVMFGSLKDSGLLDRTPNQANAENGFTPGFWLHKDSTKASPGNLKAPNVQRKDFRTAAEAAVATAHAEKGTGLDVITNYGAALGNYVQESMEKVAQNDMIIKLKEIRPVNKSGLPTVQDSKGNTVDIGYIAYQTDPAIVKNEQGLRPANMLTKLGYIQMKNAPGLVDHRGSATNMPWVHRDVYGLLSQLYDSKPKSTEFTKSLLAVNGFVKRQIMLSPYNFAIQIASSPMLWMDPKTLWNVGIKPLIWGGGLGVQGVKEHMANKTDAFAHMNNYGYDPKRVSLLQRHGQEAFLADHVMETLFDKKLSDKHPTLRDPMAQLKDTMGGKAGIDNYVFNHYVARIMYTFSNSMIDRFIADPKFNPQITDKNARLEEAARLAVAFTSSTSGMIDKHRYGAEAKFLQVGLFARNFTMSFLQQVTGAMYPVNKALGFKHKYRVGNSSVLNSLLHGDKSSQEMDYLSKYYQAHLARIITIKLVLFSLLQFGLSFMDDDDKDKEEGIFAKKRWMFQNEPGKFARIRLPNVGPFKTPSGERTYADPLIWRELSQFVALAERGPLSFAKGKLSWGVKTVVEQIENRNFMGLPITNDSGEITIGEQLSDRAKHIVGSTAPTFFRAKGKTKYSTSFLGGAAGLNIGTGSSAEDPHKLAQQRRMVKQERYYSDKIRKIIKGSSIKQLRDPFYRNKHKITYKQSVNEINGRERPGRIFSRRNRSVLRKNRGRWNK